MKKRDSVEKMWFDFLNNFPENKEAHYENWFFGDDEQMAIELSALVMQGIKTATCGALWEYEKDGESLPLKGDFSIVTNYYGEAQCIIQTTKVIVQKFSDVNADFARKEGEGDLSYTYWRKVHTDFLQDWLPIPN